MNLKNPEALKLPDFSEDDTVPIAPPTEDPIAREKLHQELERRHDPAFNHMRDAVLADDTTKAEVFTWLRSVVHPGHPHSPDEVYRTMLDDIKFARQLHPRPNLTDTRPDLRGGDRKAFMRYNRRATGVSLGAATLDLCYDPAELIPLEKQSPQNPNLSYLAIPPVGILRYSYELTGINLPTSLSGEVFQLMYWRLKYGFNSGGQCLRKPEIISQVVQQWSPASLDVLRLQPLETEINIERLLRSTGHNLRNPFSGGAFELGKRS